MAINIHDSLLFSMNIKYIQQIPKFIYWANIIYNAYTIYVLEIRLIDIETFVTKVNDKPFLERYFIYNKMKKGIL